MKFIYLLEHLGETFSEDLDEKYFIKTLGYFITQDKLKNAINKYKILPGFKNCNKVYYETEDIENKHGFHIYKVFINKSYWKGGFCSEIDLLKEVHNEQGTTLTVEYDETIKIYKRNINLPFWLKNENLLKNYEELFTKKYGLKNYPQGLGSEFYNTKEFVNY